MAKTEDVKVNTRAKEGKQPKKTVVQYTFAETLAESQEWYGEKLCNDLIKNAIKVKVQAAARPLLDADKPQEEIQAAASAYKPEEGSRRGRVKYIKDMDALKEEFASMPAAEKASMLAMFEAYLRGEDLPAGAEDENGEDENGDEEDDDDEEGDQPPPPTESPPSGANRVGRRPRGPQYT